MGRILIFIHLFISLLYIIKFCECDSDWLIFEEAGVEYQYFEFKRSAITEYTRKLEDVDDLDLEKLDKFLKKTPAELESICKQFKNSKIYRPTTVLLQFPQPVDLEFVHSSEPVSIAKIDTKEIKYTYRPLKSYFGAVIGKIPVFPCETHNKRVYWLTYGYSSTSTYLLQEVDDGEAVSFVGRAEKVPQVDAVNLKGEFLDEYYQSPIPEQTVKFHNPFANSTLFRVCCLAYEARQRARIGNDEKFTINYASFDQHGRFEPILSEDKLEEELDILRVVGCVINRKPEGPKITFYLSQDPRQPDAIFVLDTKRNELGKDDLTLTARIVGLSAQNQYGIYFG